MKNKILSILRLSTYLVIIALVLAYFEIQIEGVAGWAANLPTWRIENQQINLLIGGRPITGYHISLDILLLLFLHWPSLFTPWDIKKESMVLEAFTILAVIWDFLWFVINPHFGLENFSNDSIWWFANWVIGFPIDYFIGIFFSLILGILPGIFRKEPLLKSFIDSILMIAFCTVEILVITIILSALI